MGRGSGKLGEARGGSGRLRPPPPPPLGAPRAAPPPPNLNQVSVVGEIVMASVLGGAMAMAWKTFHWNTRSHIADVYAGRVKGQ